MISANTCFKLLDVALSSGGEFAEIYYESRETNLVEMEDERIRSLSYGNSTGVGIRVIKGEEVGYAHSDSLEPETLKQAVLTSAKIGNGKRKSVAEMLQRTHLPSSPQIKKPSGKIPSKERIDLVKKADEAARDEDEKIRGVKIGYYDLTKHFIIANSDGVLVEDEVFYTSLRIQALAINGKKRHPGVSGCSGHIGWEIFDDLSPDVLGREAADMAIRMLKAKETPAGSMPVIIGKGNGVIIHEAIGHGLEADTVQKGRSVYGDKLGKVVASSVVTIADDPTHPFRGGSIRVDDEGTPAQKTLLIEGGVLRGFLFDRVTARRSGAALTGNGRRQSFRFYPIPRMTNTCLLSGSDDPEEILRETKKGLYVKRIGGGQVNTASGDYVFGVLEGWLIENGKLSCPVREASLIGNGIETLLQVDRVGNDFSFDTRGGFCGKGQLVPVGFAQPTIRVKAMTIGGTKK